jgi:integrase
MKLVDRKERERGWKGRNRYFIDYRDQNGKRKCPGFRLKQDAEREFARLQRLKANGWHPSAEADYVTFGQAMDEYLADGGLKFDMRHHREDKWEASTLELKRNAAEKHVRPAVGHLTLASLARNSQPLQKLLDSLAKSVRTPETVLSIINGTIEFAMKRRHWLTHNFLLDRPLDVPRRKRKERTMPTPAELAALLEAVKERQPNEKRYAFEQRQLIFALMLTPPFARRGEIAALHWEDISDDGRVHIHRSYSYQHERKTREVFKNTKTDNDRWVPLSDLVKHALIPIWKRQGGPRVGLILKSPSGRPIYGQLREGFFLYTMRKAGLTIDNGRPNGIGKYRMHDMRHLGESLHLQRGGHYKQIAQWAGHSEQTLRQTYEHLLPGDERTANVSKQITTELRQLMLPAPDNPSGIGDYQYQWRQRRQQNGNK